MARNALTLFIREEGEAVHTVYRGNVGVYTHCDYTFWNVTDMGDDEFNLGPKVIVEWSKE